ncbi:hypothetical protein, partial [Akkermansia muciniphila]|uniref:hypothetical protein n=1 Tax=Akkermansia muciniphila TaxID=239935 RepID=UPI00196196E0
TGDELFAVFNNFFSCALHQHLLIRPFPLILSPSSPHCNEVISGDLRCLSNYGVACEPPNKSIVCQLSTTSNTFSQALLGVTAVELLTILAIHDPKVNNLSNHILFFVYIITKSKRFFYIAHY